MRETFQSLLKYEFWGQRNWRRLDLAQGLLTWVIVVLIISPTPDLKRRITFITCVFSRKCFEMVWYEDNSNQWGTSKLVSRLYFYILGESVTLATDITHLGRKMAWTPLYDLHVEIFSIRVVIPKVI